LRAVVAAVVAPGVSIMLPSTTPLNWDTHIFYAAVSHVFGEETTVRVDLEVADCITKVVRKWLEAALLARLANRNRKSHWAFQWFRANAGALVVVLLALGKLKTRNHFPEIVFFGCFLAAP
jgi:hypothetical protein